MHGPAAMFAVVAPGCLLGGPMRCLLLDLWPVLGRLLLLGVMVCGLFLLLLLLPTWDVACVIAVAVCCCSLAGCLVVVGWRQRWLWRFVGRTRRFLTASSGRIVLRYAPEVRDLIDPREVLSRAEKALAELEGKFGPLTRFWHGPTIGPILFRRRVHVYLFATGAEVQAVFGQRYGGIALTWLHAVVFPMEWRLLDEWLRHELGHLFSDRWNPWAPPLFQEGLSVWLQGTEQGHTVDENAAMLLWQQTYRLRPLLDRKFFFRETEHWTWYVLAGSFSGFLIARFGWDAYERFYRDLGRGRNFDTKFRTHFGLTLEEAEDCWREKLLSPSLAALLALPLTVRRSDEQAR
jgi:hypothetical protein